MKDHDIGQHLGNSFLRWFELLPALDNATKDQVFRLRHEVYCRDLGWEPVSQDKREIDEFDSHSFHCLLRRRDTGEPVGCVRLVRARSDDPLYPLPFEQTCKEVLNRRDLDPVRLPRESVGEVSRLAVLKKFRQRKGEATDPFSMSEADLESHENRIRFPFIPVSLYLGATAIAQRLGVEHVFILTEPRLAKHFSRLGFPIRTVGTPIEHKGARIPSYLSSTRVVAEMRPLIRPLYSIIESKLREAMLEL
jgi:N-acyl amino acid synthase of PEP-CTERM/exosortase system